MENSYLFTYLCVFTLLLIAYIIYLHELLEDQRRIANSRQEVIDDLLTTQKYHDELQLWLLAMIASDCTIEEIKEYLDGL